jgi:Xaa-Pro aminopeptidase
VALSTEINMSATLLEVPDEVVPDTLFDPVLHTAHDRPNTCTLPVLTDPTADHQDEHVKARRAEVEQKHQQVGAFLDAFGYDALVLGRADSIAWFTSGGDVARGLAYEQGSVLLFINRHSRAVLCDNVQSARVFEEELPGLGFQLKERPWHEDPARIVFELTHSRKVATDTPLGNLPNELGRLRVLRRSLTRHERQKLRDLGRTLTLAVEATCRNFQPGETEADVAGHLAHRLVREGIVPVEIRVASDDRLDRYRQPIFKNAPINRRATVAAVGRRHGLCASVTRTVGFGPVDARFRADHGLAAMVDATCIYFSRPGETVAEVFRRARRIYEKFGHPDEWTLDYQGAVIGYSPCEALLRPESPLVLAPNTPLCWSPSVGPARSEDTVVIDERGYEVVTEAQNWPKVEVIVKGFPMARPGILER